MLPHVHSLLRPAGRLGLLLTALAAVLPAQFQHGRGADIRRLSALLAAGDEPASRKLATALVTAGIAQRDAALLNDVAWVIVDPVAEVAHRDLELAMRAATQAVEWSAWEQPSAIDTLARVHAWQGDIATAAAVQQRALTQLYTTSDKVNRGSIAAAVVEYRQRLLADAPPPPDANKRLRVPAGCAPAAAASLDGWCKVVVHKATGLRFRLVGGEFTMGAAPDDAAGLVPHGNAAKQAAAEAVEQPQRRVRVSPFYLAEQETSVAVWRKFVDAVGYLTDAQLDETERGGISLRVESDDMARIYLADDATWANPLPYFAARGSHTLDERHPVAQVSWCDAMMFCAHFGLRLPTEAEWEQGCRGGTSTRFWWGDDASDGKDKDNVLDVPGAKYAIRAAAKSAFPFHDGHCFFAPVDAFPPNPFGLRCMHGNVAEWCADLADARLLARMPADAVTVDPVGAPTQATRHTAVQRGGNWSSRPELARAAARRFARIDRRDAGTGFRAALSRH
jgi:formylglycine-generating enzyme required for sulfatase activity